MKLSVCIPMYNESAVIGGTLNTLYRYLLNFTAARGIDAELIVADDGSTDGCGEIVRTFMETHGGGAVRLRLTGYPDNRGKGAAVRCAVLASEGDVVFFTDSDLAYGADVIAEAYDRLSASPDTAVLIGSRNLRKDGYEGYTPLRKLMSKTYIKVLNIAAGFSLSDSQCGCKAFKGDCARRIFALCQTDSFAFDIEAILLSQTLHYKIAEMPVKIINHRQSKVHILRDTLHMLSDIQKIRGRVRRIEKDLGGGGAF